VSRFLETQGIMSTDTAYQCTYMSNYMPNSCSLEVNFCWLIELKFYVPPDRK